MKKVYLITMFDKVTNYYKGTLKKAFAHEKDAKLYANTLNSNELNFVVVKVDII